MERWSGGGPGPGQSASWADPLSALNVGSAGSKPAGVGRNLTAWMHPLAAFRNWPAAIHLLDLH